jgi:E3 ubiquitin-protein ligase MYLIP
MRRVFRLEYLDEDHTSQELELKLFCHHAASALYRSITEKHSFYLCETVRSSVTDQFIRDLKGTIISMFNEDTEHGKRYVFDIQRTCREVYDNSRRILHAKGVEISTFECPKEVDVDVLLEKQASHEQMMDSVVEQRIKDALNCRICMDREVDMVFNCGHMFCADCSGRCERCPVCRSEVTAVNKVFLPTELRSYSSGAKSKGDVV